MYYTCITGGGGLLLKAGKIANGSLANEVFLKTVRNGVGFPTMYVCTICTYVFSLFCNTLQSFIKASSYWREISKCGSNQ
jgi:hypothetical protein